jgi:hypothetical protein
MRTILLLLGAVAAWAQKPVFLEPVGAVDTRGAEVKTADRIFRRVPPEKYLPWLENDAARRALRLYAQPRGQSGAGGRVE